MKRCSRCEVEKPDDQFGPSTYNRCRACTNVYQRAYMQRRRREDARKLGSKSCTECKEVKDFDEFRSNLYTCRDCRRVRDRRGRGWSEDRLHDPKMRYVPTQERVQRHVVMLPNGCVRWTGCVDAHGTPLLALPGRNAMSAVRWVFQQTWRRKLRPAEYMVHACCVRSCGLGRSCDEHKLCVNPKHLMTLKDALKYDLWGNGGARPMKTHCVNGHAFTPENTRIDHRKDGRTAQACRACQRDRADARKRQQL